MSDTKVPFPNPTLHAGQRIVVSGYARAQVADYGDKRAAERDSFWQSEAGSAAPTQGAEGAAPQAPMTRISGVSADVLRRAALANPVPDPPQAVVGEASELFAIANDLHGEFDKQTYDEKRKSAWDLPDDHEFSVTITAAQERALSRAIIAYEKRVTLTPSPTPTAPQEADALREAAQVAIDVLDHYMHGGSEFRKPAVRAINALSAALAQHQPTTLRETK